MRALHGGHAPAPLALCHGADQVEGAFEGRPIMARKSKRIDMIALIRSLNQFGRALGVVGAAISQAAAIRVPHRPGMRNPAPVE